jgi:peptide/nickel transport system ATP-binding protein
MYAGNICEVADVKELFNNPKHPYTVALLEAVPKFTQQGELKTIEGNVPNLVRPPTGCRFHPRCKQAKDICQKQRPPLVEINPDHWIACHV